MVVAAECAGNWKAVKAALTAPAAKICQICRWLESSSSHTASVLNPAPVSLRIITRRRFQRSTRAPANGDTTTVTPMKMKVLRANSITELDCS